MMICYYNISESVVLILGSYKNIYQYKYVRRPRETERLLGDRGCCETERLLGDREAAVRQRGCWEAERLL